MMPHTDIARTWRNAARALKRDLLALAYAYRDPRTPWAARLLAIALVAYALSPIDLIPDPIPVLGQLDDLILLPLGIWICLRMIPPPVIVDARRRATEQSTAQGRLGKVAAAAVVATWIAVALAIVVAVQQFGQ